MKSLIPHIAECGLEDDKPDGFSITDWLKRFTQREQRKKLVFRIALKKAKKGDNRAGRYLKKVYGVTMIASKDGNFIF